MLRLHHLLFLSALFFGAWLNSWAVDFTDPRFCDRLLFHAHMGIVNRTVDMNRNLRDEFGPEINHANIEGNLYTFENDVLRLFELAPQLRDVDSFASKWNLSQEQTLDVLLYYGTRIFYRDIRVASDVATARARIRAIKSRIVVELHLHPAADRFEYYRANVLLKAVPEMASELGLAEITVYQELSLLGLSIGEALERVRAQLTPLLNQGMPLEQIAKLLRLGEQALRFVLHYDRQSNRAVYWDRHCEYEDRHYIETELLIELAEQGLSYREIADILNRVFHTESPTDAETRTEWAVKSKLQTLNFSLDGNEPAPIEKYRQQIQAADQVLDWIKANNRLPAVNRDFGKDSNPPLPRADELFSYDNPKNVLFRDFQTAWIAIKKRGEERGIPVRLYDLRIVGDFQKEFLEILRKDLIAEASDWIVTNQRLPKTTEFGTKPRQLHLKQDRLFGYSKSRGIFESTLDFWFEVQKRCKGKGFQFSLLEVGSSEDLSMERRSILREDALSLVKNWMRIQQRIPLERDFLPKGEIPIDFARFNGTDEFSAEKKLHHRRLFDSGTEAMQSIFAAAAEMGITINPFDVKLRPQLNQFNEWIKGEQKKFALKFLTRWALEHGRIPARKDFRATTIPVLGIPKDRLFGIDRYAPLAERALSRVFDSPEDLAKAVQENLERTR